MTDVIVLELSDPEYLDSDTIRVWVYRGAPPRGLYLWGAIDRADTKGRASWELRDGLHRNSRIWEAVKAAQAQLDGEGE